MNAENVLPFPEELEILASEIRKNLKRATNGREDWIEGTVGASIALYKARQKITNNIVFSNWCATNGFGPNKLNDQDRRVLVKMGEAGEEITREELRKSDSNSIQLIYRNSSAFASVSKSRIEDVEFRIQIDEQNQKLKEAKTEEEIDEVKRSAEAILKKKVEAEKERARQEEIQRQERIIKDSGRRAKEAFEKAKRINEERIKAEEFLGKNKANFTPSNIFGLYPLTIAEWNKILKCLAPDRKNSVTTDELTESYRIFIERKKVLTGRM